MKFIDLSHTIEPGMPLFSSSAPDPQIEAWMSHAQAAASGRYQDCSCEITRVNFVTSLGTYLDSPYHFHPDRPSIEKLRLEQLVLPGLVVDCRHYSARQPIGAEVLSGKELSGKAVLFYSGWSRYWGQAEYDQFPYLTREAALALVEGGARLAGVDWLVIDDMADARRPVHVTLLANDVLIVENLTALGELPESGFTFHAVPVKVSGAAAFPVRAYASIW
jgi:arylformamidase